MSAGEIDNILEILGFGPMQYSIFISCLMLQTYVTNEQLGISVILLSSKCDLNLDANRAAWILIANMFAQLISALYMGYNSDKIGRRKVMLNTLFLCMLFSLLSSLMPNFWLFFMMRTLQGLV